MPRLPSTFAESWTEYRSRSSSRFSPPDEERLLTVAQRGTAPKAFARYFVPPRLPQSLIVSGTWMGRPGMIAAGIQSLEWLDTMQRSPDGYFAPIGSNGFFLRDDVKADFDQQPVEACAMISASLDAARATTDAVGGYAPSRSMTT